MLVLLCYSWDAPFSDNATRNAQEITLSCNQGLSQDFKDAGPKQQFQNICLSRFGH